MILVDPLLSYCTTAVVKPGTVYVLVHICVCVRSGKREQGRLLVLERLIDN